MSRGSKLTDEERIAAVQEYLEGRGSYEAIAKKYGTTIGKLKAVNNIKNANKIYIGQKLIIE